jgi:hypothetical protein
LDGPRAGPGRVPLAQVLPLEERLEALPVSAAEARGQRC